MTGKTHQIIGLTSGMVVYLSTGNNQYGPATFGAVLVFLYLSSLLPDADQPAAKIWDSLPFGHAAAEITDPFIKHRNISHSLLGLAIFGFLLNLLLRHFPNYWNINTILLWYCSMVAYSMHLIADMFTVEGIPLFYPVKKMFGIPPKPFEGVRIETGKWFENLVIFPLVNLLFILLLITKWSSITLILFK